METLEELRRGIDAIDEQIVILLQERARLVLQVRAVKERERIDVYSPSRERQIIERVLALGATGVFPKEALRRVFATIIGATRSLVGELRITYPGPEFSSAYQAAVQQFGNQVRLNPASSIAEAFSLVARGESDYAVTPLEIAGAGLVSETLEALLDSRLNVLGEILLLERLCLASKSALVSEITRVYGDALSLAGVTRWAAINLNAAEIIVLPNARLAAQRAISEEGAAAVIEQALAEEFGIAVLCSEIGNERTMPSRFAVIGEKLAPRTGSDRTSLLCVVRDRAGALRDLLSPLAEQGVTLTRIESRKRSSGDWEYLFMLDLVGHIEEQKVQKAVDTMRGQCSFFRVLGSYPAVC